MYMIEISDTKVDKMSEYVEDMLWAGGELMHYLEKMKGESGYGERGSSSYSGSGRSSGSYGSRGGYGMRSRYDNYGSRGSMGYRDEEEEWEDMGERRRRDSRGRYM